jgi:hypothetical protein
MGKYGASLIHEWFSDWHIAKCKPNSFLCDQDRLWIETRYGKIVAVFDLKWQWAYESGMDRFQYSEKIVMDFFESHDVPAYLVIVDPRAKEPRFLVMRQKLNYVTELTETAFIQWIDANLEFEKLPKKIQKLDELI